LIVAIFKKGERNPIFSDFFVVGNIGLTAKQLAP
jgi:hypothetical protein